MRWFYRVLEMGAGAKEQTTLAEQELEPHHYWIASAPDKQLQIKCFAHL